MSNASQTLMLAIHPLASEADRRIDIKWLLNRAAVSNRFGYCYFRIPKCANSTVSKTLASCDPDVGVAGDDPKVAETKKRFAGLLDAHAFTPAALQSRYFLFTFVRNPYSRLLSVYLDKIAGMRIAGTGFDIVARACAVARPADVSFERFIRYLEDGGLWKNPHWAPQVSMIPVKVSRLAFVGRVESLEQDLAAVVDRLFGEGTFMSVQTRMDGRTHAAKRLGEYYDDELTRRVQVLYREDFEAFSYPFDWRLIDS